MNAPLAAPTCGVCDAPRPCADHVPSQIRGWRCVYCAGINSLMLSRCWGCSLDRPTTEESA